MCNNTKTYPGIAKVSIFLPSVPPCQNYDSGYSVQILLLKIARFVGSHCACLLFGIAKVSIFLPSVPPCQNYDSGYPLYKFCYSKLRDLWVVIAHVCCLIGSFSCPIPQIKFLGDPKVCPGNCKIVQVSSFHHTF